ncbi:hypothetical protein [Sorangium sp. So ce1151]|uniref:hypothetical protein n=1 Tax=Sorangium sp. So ce1151 TaxID=3133332 RepID=UPI003F634466
MGRALEGEVSPRAVDLVEPHPHPGLAPVPGQALCVDGDGEAAPVEREPPPRAEVRERDGLEAGEAPGCLGHDLQAERAREDRQVRPAHPALRRRRPEAVIEHERVAPPVEAPLGLELAAVEPHDLAEKGAAPGRRCRGRGRRSP